MPTPTPPDPRAVQPAAWDPQQYLRHSGHRLRPVLDLIAHVPQLPHPTAPRIADLGCGPGGPTAPLAERWPGAQITGYDNSPSMLESAAAHAGPTAGGGTLDFAHADLAQWRPDPAGRPFDLLFSNAALQWVPGHPDSFPDWIAGLAPGGTLAFQVPGNFTAPSHALLRDLCDTPRWRARVGVPSRTGAVLDPGGYVSALAPLGCEVDAWETTYTHLLHGEDAVLDWMKGTGLRPVLTLLADDPSARDAFLAEYRDALREVYRATPYGTVFPFRRIFVVATKTVAGSQ
jgi:trans-aconitate 2-methyltransferase